MRHFDPWTAVLSTCLAIMIAVFVVAAFSIYESKMHERKLKAKRPKAGKVSRDLLELDEFEENLS
jgi:hypothetical protein